MSTTERPFPEAKPHGDIKEVFPDVFFVKGTVTLTRGVPFSMSFSRNMTIVRTKDGNLILLNSLRLNDQGLEELDKLGTVTDVIRCGGFHGMDDAFYKDRYKNATVWSPAPYFDGFEKDEPPYFEADKKLENESQELPIANSKLILIQSANPLEALVLMEHDTAGKILVTGDSLQNWSKPDEFFGWMASLMMRFMGFIKPYNVGPAWYKTVKPDKKEIVNILNLKFDHVLPSHGEPCIDKAYEKYEPAIRALK